MKKENQEISISLLIIIVAIFIGVYLMRRHVSVPVSSNTPDTSSSQQVLTGDKTFSLSCSQNKNLSVTFHLPEDKTVDVSLSDGRNLSLAHVVSADGARYANADESIVLWNKGSSVFITEGKTNTYDNCLLNTRATQ